MKTQAIFFPFDLFGSGGTKAGAELLADAVREMLADNRRERKPTRARAYANKVGVEEFAFETLEDYTDWRQQARKTIRAVWQKKDFLLWATGNHLGVLPAYEELATQAASPTVIQFDAHLDVYNLSDCTQKLSHGNFLMHCEGPLPSIINVGHRELLLPHKHVTKYFTKTYSAADVASSPDKVVGELQAAAQVAHAIFFDLDCDAFDPAYFPSAAHPIPFGLSPHFVLRCLDALWSDRVLGLAISEFDPARDVRDQSLSTLVWLIEHLLLKINEK
ncbi:MAG: arginase family protein [Gemmataceae bacterium]|nr:arginase family protein [Gemmataceae bacterium]